MTTDEKLDELKRLAAIGAEAERYMERGRTWRSALTCGCIFEDEQDPDRCTRPCRHHAEMERELREARARIAELEASKDGAYLERNRVVALVASLFPSGLKRTNIPGWNPEWHGCVYIDLPTGQAWPGLGGSDREFIMVRRNEPLKGEEIGRFRVSSIDADLAEGSDWYRHDGGYWVRQPHLPPPNGYLHRIIAGRIWRVIPDGFEVDHIDRNPSNITRSNLRLATSAAQKLNQTRSERAGVRFHKEKGKWQAYFGAPFEHLGYFDTEAEARSARIDRLRQAIAYAHGNGAFLYPPLQVSWHYHRSHGDLFAHLPDYPGDWDGHDTAEKYRRVQKASRS